jgi:tRNA 2-thiouridine synthesizing protein C
VSSILFIQTEAPHGRINPQEGLDAILMGSAFTRCAVLFVGDGILQLLANQDATKVGSKNFSQTYGALEDYGVTHLYCSQPGLDSLGLGLTDLILPVKPLDDDAIRQLIESHDKVLSF